MCMGVSYDSGKSTDNKAVRTVVLARNIQKFSHDEYVERCNNQGSGQ